MIRIEDIEVMGMRKAIKGMRNATNSWDKSDSCIDSCIDPIRHCNGCPYELVGCNDSDYFFIGKADMDLAKCLIKAGSSDRKFMRMIHVQADVTAPLYWWKEYDTYKVGTVANSCSTMHTLHKRDLTVDDFSHDNTPIEELQATVDRLNDLRQNYSSSLNKAYWDSLVEQLPMSFLQMRTIDLDYETLYSIYHQRRNHKLDEWREFCKWIETLPYMKEFLELDEQTEIKEEENNG